MKLGIMQPYFFPYIGYWQLLNAVDKYVIYDDVNYINRGWINRNNILMSDKSKMINLPLKHASQNSLINEIEIFEDKKKKDKLLKTIEMVYRKSTYYDVVFPMIESIINYEERNLSRYLQHSIKQINKYLSINTELILSSTINKNNILKGEDKIIEICNILQADEYYNAIGGQELYSYEKFIDNGIKLKFLKANIVKYRQFNYKFIPNLSIIDVMMFNSIEDIKKMLDEYELL